MTTTTRRPNETDFHSRAAEARLNAEAYARAYAAAACGPDAPFMAQTQSICPEVPAHETTRDSLYEDGRARETFLRALSLTLVV